MDFQGRILVKSLNFGNHNAISEKLRPPMKGKKDPDFKENLEQA